MPARESVRPRDHDVTIYDADADLIDELTEFVTDGLAFGDAVVLVATAEHRKDLAASLALAGCSMSEAVAGGQLLVADAATTLATFLRDGHPEPELFLETIGGLIHEASRSMRRIRVFGEMVTLLWETGNVQGAIELEDLWNRLGRVQRFSLLCAYPTASLSSPDDLEAVRTVCDLHSEVLSPTSYETGITGDLLADDDSSRVFIATPAAIRPVRNVVVDTLRAWGQDQLVADAALLVSELATNAVRHAGSPFRVSLTRTDSVVRIAVEDLGAREPQLQPLDIQRLGGRGVALVEAMSLTWGVDPVPAGKVVWCELPVAGRLAG